jgi:hypothetical protein
VGIPDGPDIPGGLRIPGNPGARFCGMGVCGSMSPPATSQLPSLLVLGRFSPTGRVSRIL